MCQEIQPSSSSSSSLFRVFGCGRLKSYNGGLGGVVVAGARRRIFYHAVRLCVPCAMKWM